MTINFENQVAIVTGAGGGLGRQHALELGRRGARVVVNDLGGDVDGSGGSVSAAELVSQEIIDNGGQAIANGASVSDIDSVQNMIDQTMATWGRIDILVNNAGQSAKSDPISSDVEWNHGFDLKFTAVRRLTNVFLPEMRDG